MRAANAADIPAIGEAVNARLWLAGLGHIEKKADGKKLLRSMIDTSVWQPERLFFESGAYCGAGLIQKRPPFQHFPGNALSLSGVDLQPNEWIKYDDLINAAKGVKPKKGKLAGKNPAIQKQQRDRELAENPGFIALVEPMSPTKTARIMSALLYVTPEMDYQTWLQIGMGLKTSYGDAGFEIWDNWSKPASKYPGTQALRAKWLSFDRAAVTIKTLFHHARQHGWTSKPASIELPLPIRALPDDQHEPLAETASIDEAREQTTSFLKSVILNPKPNSVSGAQCTVGVGKTYTLQELFKDITQSRKNVTIVAKDRQQCKNYEDSGAFWRHGRENTEEGFVNPWHCPKAEAGGNVQRLAEKEQRLQQMCKGGHCEHGNVLALEKSRKKGREPDHKIIRFFQEHPELIYSEPCGFFDHISLSQIYDIRVVTAAGLAQADMSTVIGKDVDAIVVDESLTWSHSQFLDVPGIRKYIETLQGFLAQLDDDSEEKKALELPIAVFSELSEKLGKQSGSAPKGEYQPISFDVENLANNLTKLTDKNGVAAWEQPHWLRWLELVQSPLKTLAAIKDGIEADSLSIVDGKLHITYLHPVLSYARKKGIPIIILDATLDATAQSICTEIKHIVATPNVEYVCDPRWFFSAKKDDESLSKEMKKALATRAKLEKTTGRESYIICRKTLALYMISRLQKIGEDEFLSAPREQQWSLSLDLRIGWWGWHDAAMDDWKGLNGLLWGQMPTPDEVQLQHFADHRAALMLLGVESNLPLPDNKWTRGQEVRTGDHMQLSMVRLPEQPEVRVWLLRRVSNQRIQAAGRSRAVCHPQKMTIWQCGGYPVTGLAEHGIRPVYQRLVPGMCADEVGTIHHARRQEMMDRAAALAIASGRQITRDTLREFVETLCNILITKKSKTNTFVRDGYIYIYRHRTKRSNLDYNENNELQDATFTSDASVWNDEYTKWRQTAHAGMRLHFAQDRATIKPEQGQEENCVHEDSKEDLSTDLQETSGMAYNHHHEKEDDVREEYIPGADG